MFKGILNSNFNYGFDEAISWGLAAGDKRVPADYDGDGKTDVAMWRQSDGVFYVRQSSNGTLGAFKWGIDGDIPQPADYDGDGKADFAVWRPSSGNWYILTAAPKPFVLELGLQGDQPITSPYRIQ